ncbi:hypothetical protein MMC10_005732 [Thelotrema lepadinum]|nr:hypothetical protein [Thelotrema lepadinum]
MEQDNCPICERHSESDSGILFNTVISLDRQVKAMRPSAYQYRLQDLEGIRLVPDLKKSVRPILVRANSGYYLYHLGDRAMELREALGGVSARCERYGEPYPMLFHIRKPTSLSEILELIDDEDARVGSLCRKTSRLVIKDYIKGQIGPIGTEDKRTFCGNLELLLAVTTGLLEETS